MSEATKHTPGPWKAKTLEEWVEGKGGLVVIDAPGKWLSLANAHIHRDSREEGEANARLIAAAPDLLEALEAMDALVESLWDSVPWGDTFNLDIRALNEVPGKARAAIAKAREGGPNHA